MKKGPLVTAWMITWEVSFGLDPDDNGLDPNNNGVTGDPDNGAEGDPDEDGLTNLEEQERDTSPIDPDPDGDGLLDGVETNDGNFIDADMTGTDPLQSDGELGHGRGMEHRGTRRRTQWNAPQRMAFSQQCRGAQYH